MSTLKRVMVSNKYTYETDLDVEIGTEVKLPGANGKSSWKGVVTALESTYEGPCKRILEVIDPEMLDLRHVGIIEVDVSDDGDTFWVNIDGVCKLRCKGIGAIVIKDARTVQ